MKTAVIYARFSSSKQREASIEDQVRVCTRWCVDNGYAVVGTYCDRACSGKTDQRPEFQRMIANAGESDIVLVYMMDRFSRDVYDAPIYKKRLLDAGVRVVSAMEQIPDDAPEGMLLNAMYEAMAAMESAKISQRTLRGMQGNAEKCMHNGVTVYGYRFAEDGTYAVDDEAAQNVRDAFEMRINGSTENEIARTLAARGVSTSQGNPASHTFVRNMLRNRKYIGEYSWGDVTVEHGMPQIVDDDTFAAANGAVQVKRRKSEDWRDYPLAGKSICGACQESLVGTSGNGRNGKRYNYYRCSANCGVKPMRAEELEDAVASGVRAVLGDDAAMSAMLDAIGRLCADDRRAERLAAAEGRARDAERRMRNMAQAVSDGMPYELAAEQMDALRAEAESAIAEVSALSVRADFDRDGLADFLRFGATLDDSAVFKAFVFQVWLDDSSITVTLNFDLGNGDAARFALDRGSHEVVPGSKTWAQKQGEPPAIGDDCAVRTGLNWLPECPRLRNVGVVGGRIALVFDRAA